MYWYQCEKCRETKDAREFPVMREQETIIRSDCCEPCCTEIAIVRRRMQSRECRLARRRKTGVKRR